MGIDRYYCTGGFITMNQNCANCRNRESRPMNYNDYCSVIGDYVGKNDDAYIHCCDGYEEDI